MATMMSISQIVILAVGLLLFLFLGHLPAVLAGPMLNSSDQNCSNEGQIVVVDLIAHDPCFYCMCKNGRVECLRHNCSNSQTCYLLPQEKSNITKCCDNCKGCFYQGIRYENGQEWRNPKDPCQVFSCHSGVITTSKQSCHSSLHCDHVLDARPGECCPRCQGCYVNGQQIAEGRELASPEDPCIQCRCRQGGLICSKKACPVLTCPPSKAILKPGSCCPECHGNRTTHEFKDPCLEGPFLHDNCTNCTCINATTVCERQLCPPVQPCTSSSMINLSDRQTCCPKCRTAVPASNSIHARPSTMASPPTALPATRPRTCSYRGITYQDGAFWSLDPCTQCHCNKGEVRCSVQQCPVYGGQPHPSHKMGATSRPRFKLSRSTPPTLNNVQASPCPPGRHPVKEAGQCCPKCVEDDSVCTVFGDPHYRTFDGRVFNFQGACKYLLTSDCKNNSFSVRVTNDARTSRSFSWTKTVTLTIEDLKVTLGQHMKVKVNHKRVSLPFVSLGVLSISQEGYSVVVRTNLGVKLLWDGESFLEVTVPPAFKNRLCGLCGNYNGRKQDDLHMKSGKLAKTINQFGTSWKVGGPKSCSRPDPPPHSPSTLLTGDSNHGREPLCQRQWEVRIRAVRECNAIKAIVFTKCHKKVNPVRYFKSCLSDMCECPTGKQCYCEILTAYAHECGRHGVPIDSKWREMTSCTGHGLPTAVAASRRSSP